MLKPIKPIDSQCGELIIQINDVAERVYYGVPALFYTLDNEDGVYPLEKDKFFDFIFGSDDQLSDFYEMASFEKGMSFDSSPSRNPEKEKNQILAWKKPVLIKNLKNKPYFSFFNIKRFFQGQRIKKEQLSQYGIHASEKWSLRWKEDFKEFLKSQISKSNLVKFGFVDSQAISIKNNPWFVDKPNLTPAKLFAHPPKISDIKQKDVGYCFLASSLISILAHGKKGVKHLTTHICASEENNKKYVTIKFYSSEFEGKKELNLSSLITVKGEKNRKSETFYIQTDYKNYSMKSMFDFDVDSSIKDDVYNDYEKSPWFYFYQLALPLANHVNLVEFIYQKNKSNSDLIASTQLYDYFVPATVCNIGFGGFPNHTLDLLTGKKSKIIYNPNNTVTVTSYQLLSKKFTNSSKAQFSVTMTSVIHNLLIQNAKSYVFVTSFEVIPEIPDSQRIAIMYSLYERHAYSLVGVVYTGNWNDNVVEKNVSYDKYDYFEDIFNFHTNLSQILMDRNGISKRTKEKKLLCFAKPEEIYIAIINPHHDRKGGENELNNKVKTGLLNKTYQFYGAEGIPTELYAGVFYIPLIDYFKIFHQLAYAKIWEEKP